jgi:CHAT domain-containing protein/tetratricopeptide (TPR) repeat protein
MTRNLLHQVVVTIMVLCTLNATSAETGETPVTDLSRDTLTPPGATFKSLFDSASQHRDQGEFMAAVTSAYLALGKIEKDIERGTDRARTHLLISRLMESLGYRALERIHARAALRESGASGAPMREIYLRYAEVLAKSMDHELAAFYLQNAFRQLQEESGVEPQPPEATIELMLSAASLELARANLQFSLEPTRLGHLRQASEHVDKAEALIHDKAEEQHFMPLIIALRARMLVGLSAHLPRNQESFRLKALSTAEQMISQFIAKRESAGNGHGDKMLRLRNQRLGILVQLGLHDEASRVTKRILDETEARQRGDSDIPLNMAIHAAHFDSSEQLLPLCAIVMRDEAAHVDEIARMSGEAVALASVKALRSRSMTCLSLISRFAATDTAAATTLLEINEYRRVSVGRAEAEFWRTLNAQSDPDLVNARMQLLSLRNQLSLRIDQGRHDGLWNLIDQLQMGEEILSLEPWWRDFKSNDEAEIERHDIRTFADRLIGGSSPWDAVSDLGNPQNADSVSLTGIAGRLGPKSALIEYIRIDAFDPDRFTFSDRADYWAIVVLPPGRIHAVKIGDAGEIETEIRDALDLFSNPARDPIDAQPQIERMKRLHARLWKPLEAHLEGVKRIHIVPDEALALVPFAALYTGEGSFLVEQLTLSLHGSATNIPRTHSKGDRNDARVAVFVDPTYGVPVKDEANHRSFKPLKHGPAEARHIKEIFGDMVDVYSESDATESAILTLVSPRILHLATHGSYDVAPAEPGTAEPVTLDTIASTSNYTHYVERLTRSGVALSGANLMQNHGDDDGWLTAYDVIGSNFKDTDLVMISACRAGLGARESGEGLMSIARSFWIAGASHVITTLWPLSDAEASRQVRAFYRLYSTDTDPVTALRAMQLERLKWYRRALNSEPPPAMWASYRVQRG